MKRSEAARWARWSAATACLLALLTVGVYLDHKWVAHREKEKAPPPAPAGVARQESKLTFSKGLGAQKLFTVEASKATNFKDNAASLLEDVKITIFGSTGRRKGRCGCCEMSVSCWSLARPRKRARPLGRPSLSLFV